MSDDIKKEIQKLKDELNYLKTKTHEKGKFDKLKKKYKKLKSQVKNNDKEPCCFDKPQINKVRMLYALGILIWIMILCYLNIFSICINSTFGVLIILLPVVIFLLSSQNLENMKKSHSEYLLKGNIPYIAFISIGLFINWKVFSLKTPLLFYKIIFMAITFLALSALDLWFSDIMMTLCLKTILQTLSITLLLAALYVYFYQISTHYDELLVR